ncbi:XRE family transcriptional regulator [Burkholderia cenocepacia]|uniref:XRE family transcriptional regulator n=1 Tax=Burkholderia cenocepacia TaxID=95486 RepID=UPI00222F876C|nr:XRE family transcriptional regulator [Burkholderia cenocepacia]MCW3543379.1 XRE family transcriptional regulator [Burkholderia cenocepacia]
MAFKYFPPTPEDLRALKVRLGFTGEQMAQMFGLAGNSQWRKYTGGVEPRPMSLPMLFLALALQDRSATVDQVLEKCRQVGATIELDDE